MTQPQLVLRGELYKQAERAESTFRLRWFEAFSDGTFQWAEQEGMPAKSAVSLVDAHIQLEPPLKPLAKELAISRIDGKADAADESPTTVL